VRIFVLGRLAVQQSQAVLHEHALPGNQGRLVLAMLAVEHARPLARDELADELWPHGLPRSWETALRAVVSKVRSSLAHAGLPDVIESAFGCYQLRLGNGALDVEEAAAALHRAETQLARGDARAAAVDGFVACLIARRPFLSGLYNPWTVERRARVRDLHVEARQLLAEAHAAVGDFTLSARQAQRAIDLDPYREALYQRLIRSRALAGDRVGAAAVFVRYRDLVRDELGVEPSPATVAVFNEAVARHSA
jgi:SARP family transcriptional regulator, regulator of embCAB operon